MNSQTLRSRRSAIFAFTILVLLMGSAANATPLLEEKMKAMAASMKVLLADYKDTTKRDSNMTEATKIRLASLAVVEELPDVITEDPNLVGDDRLDLEIKYRLLMTSLVAASVELESNIFKLDVPSTEATLIKMDSIRKEGHKFFKPKKP
jgi:hypothetical protein